VKLIATTTLGAGGGQLIFSNIPQTFTDLLVVFQARTSRSNVFDDSIFWFNGFNTGTYNNRFLRGNGSSVTSSTDNGGIYGLGGWINGGTSTASTFSSNEIYIPNYTSNAIKTFSSTSVSENNSTEAYQFIIAGSWSLSNAITSISIAAGAASIGQHSTASLYGITKGSDGITTAS